MGGRKKAIQNLSYLHIKISEEDKEKIKEAAEKENYISISEYVRHLLLNKVYDTWAEKPEIRKRHK